MRPGALAAALGGLGIALALAGDAHADVTHVVARGHTVEAIAHRYRVPVKTILEANHLKDGGKRLRPGDTLTIPGVAAKGDGKAKAAGGGKEGPLKPASYVQRPKQPGLVQAVRLATSESFTVKLDGKRAKVAPATLKTFERALRSSGGLSHPVEPRLLVVLTQVSNHFGGRQVQIISGFRPYSPRQHTAHSRHNVGRALDFRVAGVPNEVVRDYCRTLKNVGVGYYPNSTFVHLDVRESSAFWIDYSRPGETPRYNTPGVDADEGTSDVVEEARGDAPATAPGLNTPPSDAAGHLEPLPEASAADVTAADVLTAAAAGSTLVPLDPED